MLRYHRGLAARLRLRAFAARGYGDFLFLAVANERLILIWRDVRQHLGLGAAMFASAATRCQKSLPKPMTLPPSPKCRASGAL